MRNVKPIPSGLFRQEFVERVALAAALLAAAGHKLWLIRSQVVPFNADEAVVALMARHILQGARPLFFYGQAYMGSLDAVLIALGFAAFGQQIWVIRLVQTLLYLGTLVTTAKLGEVGLGSSRAGVLAVWLLALPTVNLSLYTTATLGGYGEALLLGNMILLASLRIVNRLSHGQPVFSWRWLLWGLLAGFGVWVFGLTLVYTIPAGILIFWHLLKRGIPRSQVWRSLLWIGSGALIGAVPYWLAVFRLGGQQLLSELSGSAIAGVEGVGWLSQVGNHLLSISLLGTTVLFGLRPPWEIRWLAAPLIPVVLAFWVWVILHAVRLTRQLDGPRVGFQLLWGVMLVLLAGFVFTPFGADPSGRYFLPLAVPLALFAGLMLRDLGKRRPWMAGSLFGVVLIFQLWGTIQVARTYPPGLTTQFDAVTQIDHHYDGELMAFLQERGLTRGYTNYWVAYPLAFQSSEALIFIPELPYHLDFRYTARDNRYVPYTALVGQAARVAYITTNHPPLNDRLRRAFEKNGVTWKEHAIGDFLVFYDLSMRVSPADLGLDQ